MHQFSPDTIGEELPSSLTAHFPPSVLNLTVEEAYAIQVQSAPWPSGFEEEDANDLDQLYKLYLSVHPSVDPNAPYWNKPPEVNQAFWAKKNPGPVSPPQP